MNGAPTAEEIRAHLDALDLDPALKRRAIITAGCRDCHSIPKVPHAGEVHPDGALRYQVMHNGVRVVEGCYYGAWMTETIRLLRGHHEPQEERVFHEVLKYLSPGSTMLELGSFWAYYSLWFRQAVAGATNYLIEPDPNNLAAGRRNFELNAAEGHFFQFSIGRRSSGPRPFLCESDRWPRLVARTSIDDFVPAQALQRVDLLLADVQGAELAMLEGAVKSIEGGKLRFLFLSTHHHSISGDPLTHQRCAQFLRDHRAHIIAAHDVTESYSGDGLIVASFDDRDRHIPDVEVSKNHARNSLFPESDDDLRGAQAITSRLKRTMRRLVSRW